MAKYVCRMQIDRAGNVALFPLYEYIPGETPLADMEPESLVVETPNLDIIVRDVKAIRADA